MPRDPHRSAKSDRRDPGVDRRTDKQGLAGASTNRLSRRLPLALVLTFFLATRLWLLLAFEPQMSDLFHLGVMALEGVDLKLTPYKEFDLEYPPVAWWLIASPRYLDSRTYDQTDPPQEMVDRYFNWYMGWFRLELFLADSICLALMFAIGRRCSATAAWGLPAAYAVLTAAQPHLIYDRLDIALLGLFLAQIFCWLRSLDPSPAANRWATASYLLLGVGISFKIMPVVFVPFLLLADLWGAGGIRPFAGRVLALGLGTAVPFLVYVPSAGWDVLALLQVHSQRGTNLGCLWSSFMLVAAKFGVPCEPYYANFGWNLTGPWSEPLKLVASVSLVTMAAAFGLWALVPQARFDRRTAIDTAILVLYNCTLLSHVFSPQYLNWMLPLTLILAVSILPGNALVWFLFGALEVANVALSSWLFPYNFQEFRMLYPVPVNVSVDFSACRVALGLLLNIAFFARYGLLPWRPAGPDRGTTTLADPGTLAAGVR